MALYQEPIKMSSDLETLNNLYAALLRAEAAWVETDMPQEYWQLRLCMKRLEKFCDAHDAARPRESNDIA
jgi:hypothetical protein